jgi:hypothetical protein
MIALNLETKNESQKIIKAYLEENASQPFADKINNGVRIEKDDKTLINKKDLDGFWDYATKKAQELKSQYMDNDTVFCWAVHYFGEDDIEGTLYNEDGSEYTPPKPEYKPVQHVPAPSISAKPTPPKTQQYNLFDMMAQAEKPKTEEADDSDEVQATTPEVIEENNEQPTELDIDLETGEILNATPIEYKPNSLYLKYIHFQNQYPQAVIAYRLGDFFEIFGDNAIKVSNRLELTLTGRDCGLPERVPMVGFPHHASDTYFRKIAEFTQLVVVDDNTATPYVLEEKTAIKTPAIRENEPTAHENNDDFKEERELQQFFDMEALSLLFELFEYNLDIK